MIGNKELNIHRITDGKSENFCFNYSDEQAKFPSEHNESLSYEGNVKSESFAKWCEENGIKYDHCVIKLKWAELFSKVEVPENKKEALKAYFQLIKDGFPEDIATGEGQYLFSMGVAVAFMAGRAYENVPTEQMQSFKKQVAEEVFGVKPKNG